MESDNNKIDKKKLRWWCITRLIIKNFMKWYVIFVISKIAIAYFAIEKTN